MNILASMDRCTLSTLLAILGAKKDEVAFALKRHSIQGVLNSVRILTPSI
jgi:hypothetical protein